MKASEQKCTVKHYFISVFAPEYFDKSDNNVHKRIEHLIQKDSGDGLSSSECTEITPETSDTSLTCNDKEKGDHVRNFCS